MSGTSDAHRSTVLTEFLQAYDAADWTRAVAMVEQHWTDLIFAQETYRQTFDAIARAPEEALRNSRRAATFAETIGRLPPGSAKVTVPGTPARIEQALRAGTARDLVELAALGMVTRRVVGAPSEAAAIARASRPLVRAATVTRFSPAADLAAFWHLQAAQAELHAGDLQQARGDFELAWSFRDDDVTGYAATSAAPFLALLAALAGRVAESARWQTEVDRLAAHGRTLIEWETMERPRLVARLLEATDRLDLDVGAELSETLTPQLAFDEIWPVSLLALVRHLVNVGSESAAGQLIEATVQLHPNAPDHGSFHSTFTTLARADVALALGHSATLGRLLGSTDEQATPAVGRCYAVGHEILLGDLSAAHRLAEARDTTHADPRGRDESHLLGEAACLASGSGRGSETVPLPPHLRRVASLLPAGLNAALRTAYGAVPPPQPALAGVTTPAVRLTASELRVLEALTSAKSLPVIADLLNVSHNTVKTHVRALYVKLDVTSREQAVAIAGRLGLLENDEGPPPRG